MYRNPGDVLETFNFLENADDSDEDDDDDEEGDLVADITGGKQKHRINKKHKIKVIWSQKWTIMICYEAYGYSGNL